MTMLPPNDVAAIPQETQQTSVSYRIPMYKPRWTFILLGINIAVFVLITVFGMLNGLGLNGTQDTRLLLMFGAHQSQLVAGGQYHRLFTSMFLHIGIIHLLFNSWALYVVGQDVERLYGSPRFLTIYMLSGLGGSLTSFVLGGASVSAGASGAIFGLIGAEIVYFYLHRKTFGRHGQQHLRSLLLVAGVNLLFGLTVPGINNLAHMGGMAFGAVLGWLLAPQYQPPSIFAAAADEALVLEDSTTIGRRIPSLVVVTLALVALGVAGTIKWR